MKGIFRICGWPVYRLNQQNADSNKRDFVTVSDLETRLSQYLGRRAFQRGCYFQDVQNRDVPLATLNLAHVRSVDTRSVGQCFLRQAQRLAARPNDITEARQLALKPRFSRYPRHACLFASHGKYDHGIYDPF